MATKQKRKELSLKEKVSVIRAHEEPGSSQRKLAAQFGIGKTQVQCILKRKAEYMAAYEENDRDEIKRTCHGLKLVNIESATWEWFKRARAMSMPVSGPLVREQALRIAARLGNTEFKASNGWLDRFRKRHNVTFGAVCGERSSVDLTCVDTWKEKLPSIVDGYEPRNIYNMDETGLFYRALPEKSLREKGDSCSGGKKSKDRITASLCVNAVGDFEKTFVIGHSENPRCFKNISACNLPVIYKANKKAWMTSALFEEWITKFNRRMCSQDRSVLLFLDNAPSHPRDLELSHVRLVYLPPNSTSVLQPLDQGIIQCVKVNYRKRLLRHVLNKMETATSATDVARSVSVLDACQWLSASVNEVKKSTVEKCFISCGLFCVPSVPRHDSDDEDDLPLSHLLQIAKDRQVCQDIITDAQDYASMDQNLHSTDTEPGWEDRLLDDLLQADTPNPDTTEHAEPDPESATDPEPSAPSATYSDALQWTAQLRNFIQHSCPELFQSVCHLEDRLQTKALLSHTSKQHQTTLDFLIHK